MKLILLIALCATMISKSEQIGKPVCYDRVGCFKAGKPFFTFKRPFNLLPQSPDTVLTQYLLFTRDSQEATELDARKPEDFSTVWPTYKKRLTKIIVHGFLDNLREGRWEKDMKNELLLHGDYNVILVDWHHGNGFPYTQATGNTRLIGAQIADLIKTIQRKLGQQPSEFHIIGHSLGAHIAGYAGERIVGLGRITGLDPAGPYFINTDPQVRLDRNDATFVDVIHSDGETLFTGGFGTTELIGHADFRPNLGRDQPSCSSIIKQLRKDGIVTGMNKYLGCEHMLSYIWFIESINTKCPFTAFPCANEQEYIAGTCQDCASGDCRRMGLHAQKPKSPTTYFLRTLNSSPYCAYNYQLSVRLSSNSARETGQLKIKLFGENGHSDVINITKELEEYRPGDTYKYTVPAKDVGALTSLQLGWNHESEYTDVWKWNPFGLRHPTLSFDRLEVQNLETKEFSRFCAGGSTIETDQTVTINQKC